MGRSLTRSLLRRSELCFEANVHRGNRVLRVDFLLASDLRAGQRVLAHRQPDTNWAASEDSLVELSAGRLRLGAISQSYEAVEQVILAIRCSVPRPYSSSARPRLGDKLDACDAVVFKQDPDIFFRAEEREIADEKGGGLWVWCVREKRRKSRGVSPV